MNLGLTFSLLVGNISKIELSYFDNEKALLKINLCSLKEKRTFKSKEIKTTVSLNKVAFYGNNAENIYREYNKIQNKEDVILITWSDNFGNYNFKDKSYHRFHCKLYKFCSDQTEYFNLIDDMVKTGFIDLNTIFEK